ncbi:MAG: hypothetical protein ACREGB_00175 [Candidatus Saccharimonadales bacterium]
MYRVTRAERDVLRAISKAHKAFADLPQDHPDDIHDYVQGIHIMQGLVMQRIARRANPKNFPRYLTTVVIGKDKKARRR